MSVRPSFSWSAWILVTLLRPAAGAASIRKRAKTAPAGILSAVLTKFRRVIRIPIVEQDCVARATAPRVGALTREERCQLANVAQRFQRAHPLDRRLRPLGRAF